MPVGTVDAGVTSTHRRHCAAELSRSVRSLFWPHPDRPFDAALPTR